VQVFHAAKMQLPPPAKRRDLPDLAQGFSLSRNGVVQNRVTLETRNPFSGAALSIFGVTRNHQFLNHADAASGAVSFRGAA
jgi:hypothetical protein